MKHLNTRKYHIDTQTDNNYKPTYTIYTETVKDPLFIAALDTNRPIITFHGPSDAEPFATATFRDKDLQEVSYRGSQFALTGQGHLHKKHTFTALNGDQLTWTKHLTELRCENEHGDVVARAKDGGLSGYGKEWVELDEGLGEDVLVAGIVYILLLKIGKQQFPAAWAGINLWGIIAQWN